MISDLTVLPLNALYMLARLNMLARPSTPPRVRDEVLERVHAGEQVTGVEIARLVHELPPPKVAPQEVSIVTEKAPWPIPRLPEQPELPLLQPLYRALKALETQVTDPQFDAAAERLIESGQIERRTFKRIGAALGFVGNTVQATPNKRAVAATADKYMRPKPH
jgi:hypothetical protein